MKRSQTTHSPRASAGRSRCTWSRRAANTSNASVSASIGVCSTSSRNCSAAPAAPGSRGAAHDGAHATRCRRSAGADVRRLARAVDALESDESSSRLRATLPRAGTDSPRDYAPGVAEFAGAIAAGDKIQAPVTRPAALRRRAAPGIAIGVGRQPGGRRVLNGVSASRSRLRRLPSKSRRGRRSRSGRSAAACQAQPVEWATPAMRPRPGRRGAGLIFDDRRQRQCLVGAASGRSGSTPPRPRRRRRCIARCAPGTAMSVRPCCRRRCRDRNGLPAPGPGRPIASMTSSSDMPAVAGLSESALRQFGAELAEGPAFDQAHGGERLVAAHHLLQQFGAATCPRRSRSCRRGMRLSPDQRNQWFPAPTVAPARPHAPSPARCRAVSSPCSIGESTSRPRAGAAGSATRRRCRQQQPPRRAAPRHFIREQAHQPLHHRDHDAMQTMAADDNRPMSVPPSQLTVSRLAHWGLMWACGADAARFLPHGQLTQRHAATGANRLVPAGFCSAGAPAGELHCPGTGADELLLARAADLLAATLRRLSMFVLRAQ